MSVQNYTTLGESGLNISKIIVGCMSFGSSRWMDWVIEDEDKVMEILYKCYQSGLTTFDTADMYSNGLSEKLLGKFIKKYDIPRGEIVILTKCFFPVNPEDLSSLANTANGIFHLNTGGLSRKHILQAARASVERLGTYIDVLQIHRLDKTPRREIMKALNDVVDEGLARYIGASAMKAFEFVELQALAESNSWHKFISMQNYYNLLYREQEREMIPFCQNNTTLGKVTCIPYSPLARGLLGKPVDSEKSLRTRTSSDKMIKKMYHTEGEGVDIEIINRVEEIAKKRGVSMANVSIAWVLSKGCCPIIGFNSVERVEDAVYSFGLELTKEEIEYLEEPYVPKPSVT
ncbi:aldo-keto reductase superfamily protein [Saccharomycopsis crataegensis]|uniref:Aldo-keto reductase superfamily protein n=1 Tax=Saccharomycopsis crataegensis TaxID=43959 RepID=A0AAV5QJT6_9ASCO|nr:aldo-keto reductase superfamily protein [Saccharomycopsis crataegensis]